MASRPRAQAEKVVDFLNICRAVLWIPRYSVESYFSHFQTLSVFLWSRFHFLLCHSNQNKRTGTKGSKVALAWLGAQMSSLVDVSVCSQLGKLCDAHHGLSCYVGSLEEGDIPRGKMNYPIPWTSATQWNKLGSNLRVVQPHCPGGTFWITRHVRDVYSGHRVDVVSESW